MGYIHLVTTILENTDIKTFKEGAGCLVKMDCDASIAEFMSAAAALVVEAESKVPEEDRVTFRADFLALLNNRRKINHLI